MSNPPQPPWRGQGPSLYTPAEGGQPKKSRAGLKIGAVVAALVLAAGAVVAVVLGNQGDSTSIPGTAWPTGVPGVASTTASCAYPPSPADSTHPVPRNVGLPDHADQVPATGTVSVSLTTEHGLIPLVLDRAKSPCAVQAIVFLATKKYFDGSPCHRLTVAFRAKMLQCGDPSGTGRGGPGFGFKDKPPTGLQPGRDGKVVYPTGTVAMADVAGTGYGSQFLLIYGDTEMAASQPVIGTYRDPGQATLDAIASGGTEWTTMPGTALQITRPKTPVTIQQATVTG